MHLNCGFKYSEYRDKWQKFKKTIRTWRNFSPPKSTIVAYYLRSMVLETEYIEDHYK